MLLLAAVLTSIGAGVTMPVMNIIFGMICFWVSIPLHSVNQVVGRMVNSFTGYFSQDASTTYEMFRNAISTCA